MIMNNMLVYPHYSNSSLIARYGNGGYKCASTPTMIESKKQKFNKSKNH